MPDPLRPDDLTQALPTSGADPARSYHGPALPEPGFFPGFAVKGVLGRGGFGAVYLARELGARRDIAIKSSHDPSRAVSPDDRERFREEALVTAQLQHPGVVPIYRLEQDARGSDYYTMRPVEGRTLEWLLDRMGDGDEEVLAAFPLKRLVRTFHAVCQTVRYAHDRGVIHRDLKPANIVVGEYGEVLVIDWGLAKVLGGPAREPELVLAGDEDPRASVWARYQREVESLRRGKDSTLLLTVDGAVSGTPLYMAPEQALGQVAEMDQRTDVWALGVILHEICTLRPPFEAEDFKALAEKIVRAEFPDPQLVNPSRRVPPELAEVIRRCLRAAKAERYASVAELSKDVEDWLEGVAPWRLVADVDFSTMPDGEPEGWRSYLGQWRVEQGLLRHTLATEADILLDKPVPGDVRVEVEAMVIAGESGEISPMISAQAPVDRDRVSETYFLEFGSDDNTQSKIAKKFADVAVSEAIILPGQWYQVAAELVGGWLRLAVDGTEVLKYRDYLPLRGDRVGLYAYGNGLRVRRFRVWSRGVPATLSCLEVPNAFHGAGLVEKARAEYLRVAESHPGRDEGLEALFHAGRCSLELARGREAGPEREALLTEAWSCFERLEKSYLAPLGCLGKSLVWAERGETAREAAELSRAFRDYPGYDTLHVVGERLWERAVTARFRHDYDVSRLFAESASVLYPEVLCSAVHLDTVLFTMAFAESRGPLQKAASAYSVRSHVGAIARRHVATCCLREGRLEEALALLGQVLDQTAHRSNARTTLEWMARGERYRGHYDESDALLDRAEFEYPELESQGADAGRAFGRLARREYDAAVRICEAAKLAEPRPHCDWLRMAKAVAFILRGESEQACVAALKDACAWLDGTRARVFLAALDQRDTESANWVKAPAAFSQPIFRFGQGLVAAARGDRAAATDLFRKVVAGYQTEPSTPDEAYELSLIMLRAWGEMPSEPAKRV